MSSNKYSTDAIDSLDCLNKFTPHTWWRGGWLQTISIKALRSTLDVNQWPGAHEFVIEDDRSPPDRLTGFYLPPKLEKIRKPTVLIFHGMGGHALSGYMQSMAGTLLENGYPVILWNHRGAGGSSRGCSQFHHPGYTDDIRRLVTHLHSETPQRLEHGLNAVGFSLGANPMLRYLAEEGDDCRVDAAISISAPLDMEITSKNLRNGWNRVFDKYLLKKQRDEVLRQGAELSDDEREAVNAASSVWELDDQFTAKRYGFPEASEYYQANSAIYVLDEIRTPTLLLHAMDDPVVDHRVFSEREWTDQGPLFAALAESGGHTGFLDQDGQRWHEQCAVEFFDWQLNA